MAKNIVGAQDCGCCMRFALTVSCRRMITLTEHTGRNERFCGNRFRDGKRAAVQRLLSRSGNRA